MDALIVQLMLIGLVTMQVNPSVCSPICGDGFMISPETCDDGSNDGIGCAIGCIGVSPGYTCTGGSPTSATVCNSLCGNSVLNTGE